MRDLWRASKANSYILNSNIFPIPKKLDTHFLQQLGIVNVLENMWIIEKKFNQYVELLKNETRLLKNQKKTLSQQQLDNILHEQKRIGNFAEELTVKFEINRFKKMKLIEESKNVKQISKSNVNKGYDIDSFLSNNNNLKPNFFIEVKGRKYRFNSFIISICISV